MPLSTITKTGSATKNERPRQQIRMNSMNPKFFQPGVKVWINNPYDEGGSAYRAKVLSSTISTRPMFVPAVVIAGVSAEGKVTLTTVWSPKVTVVEAVQMIWPINDVGHSIDDMIDYTHLHEPAILNNIQKRYQSHQIYTKAGEILIAMNPYQLVVDSNGIALYDQFYMKQYQNRPTNYGARTGDERGTKLSPHIFETANDVYRHILADKKSQSIIISGESGAGKTETTKQVMQFITNLSCTKPLPTDVVSSRRRSNSRRHSINISHLDSEVPLIEQQLLQSNPILESFGNAKTLRNNNSSRFGKYLKIIFDERGNIMGGTVNHFLLEKSRICDQLQGERSYHFFYQLCRGISASIRGKLFLQRPENYVFLNKSGSHNVSNAYMGGPKSSDESDFVTVENALKVVGLKSTEILEIYKIVSVVLQLGNIEFVEIDCPNSSTGMSVNSVELEKEAHLEAACSLLEIDKGTFMEAITTKQTKAGGQVLVSKIDVRQAQESTVSLAKALYARLFTEIVRAINIGIKKTVKTELGTSEDFDTNPKYNFLGLLDIFGFEVFSEGNGFEQLLINYANERLHNLFIKHVFRLEEEKYKQEGIDYSSVSFTDNQNVIDLIGKKPYGLFYQVSDACLFGKMKDDIILEKIAQKFRKMKKSHNSGPAGLFSLAHISKKGCFVIKHSANNVTYSIDGFSKKNKDLLKPQVEQTLVNCSKLVIMKNLFSAEKVHKSTVNRSTLTGSNVMLSLRFEENITKLIQTIERTVPRFVRCIKSNEVKRPFFFDTQKVYNQLQYLGVLDSVRIRHDGYSYQKYYRHFFEHFVIVIPAPKSSQDFQVVQPIGANYRMLSIKVMEVFWKWGEQSPYKNTVFSKNKKSSLYQFGNTKLFMRKEFFQALETLREMRMRKMNDASTKLQSAYRMFRTKAHVKKVESCTGRIQAAFRGIHYRKKWMKRKNAVSVIQKWSHAVLSRRLWARQKNSILILQSYFRRCFGRLRFLRIRRGLRVLHGLSRGFIVRRHVLRMLRAVKIIQTSVRRYLESMALHWTKVRSALLIQALWRGKRLRRSREDIVEYLAVKREERGKIIALVKLQGAWKMCLVKRRYRQIVESVCSIHRFYRSIRLRRKFLEIRNASKLLQRVARGMLIRKKIRKMRTINLVADELWRLKTLREREALDLNNFQNLSLSYQFGQEPSKFIQNDQGQFMNCYCIDIDTHIDTSYTYPSGWVKGYHALVLNLAKLNRKSTQISVGANHSLGVDTVGNVYSWGWGDRGQLGHGSFENLRSARKVSLLNRLTNGTVKQGHKQNISRPIGSQIMVRELACGDDHSVVLAREGTVYSWGSNSKGQLGLGILSKSKSSPSHINSLKSRIGRIACGAHHTVALTLSGKIFIWGQGEQLGLGVFRQGSGDQSLPQHLKSLARYRVRHIACGISSTVVQTHNGDMYSWGCGKWGQLGLGDLKHRFVPCIIKHKKEESADYEKFSSFACGARHCIATSHKGSVYTWGWNSFGQLGLGHTQSLNSPTMVMSLEKERICQVAAGWRHSIALSSNMVNLYAWGVCSCLRSRNINKTNVDPDKDIPLSKSTVPLRIPWKGGVRREVESIHVSWSRALSITTIDFFQSSDLLGVEHQYLVTGEEDEIVGKKIHAHKGSAKSVATAAGANRIYPKELRGMNSKQLKELILDMQDIIPYHTRILQSDDSKVLKRNNRIFYMTDIERQQEFGLRAPGQHGGVPNFRAPILRPRTASSAVDRAKERAWNKFNSKPAVMGNSLQKNSIHSELAKFGRKEDTSIMPTSLSQLKKKDGTLIGVKDVLSSSEKQKQIEERKRIEGFIPEGRILELFSPELLVCTSNEDLSVADIIAMRRKRGLSPTKTSRNTNCTQPKKMVGGNLYMHQQFGESYSPEKAKFKQLNSNSTLMGLVGRDFLLHSRVRNEKSRVIGSQVKQAHTKRDILKVFRSQKQACRSHTQHGYYLTKEVASQPHYDMKEWSGRRPSESLRIKKKIESEILINRRSSKNATPMQNLSHLTSQHKPHTLQGSAKHPSSEFTTSERTAAPPMASSYLKLQNEVEFLKEQLTSKQLQYSVDATSSVVRGKAQSDIYRILNSDDF